MLSICVKTQALSHFATHTLTQLIRMGGAASMFSNKPSMRPRAKYELVAASRVCMAADDEAYG